MTNYDNRADATEAIIDLADNYTGGYAFRHDIDGVFATVAAFNPDGTVNVEEDPETFTQALTDNLATPLRGVITNDDGVGEVEIFGWSENYIEEVGFLVDGTDVPGSVKDALQAAGYRAAGRHPNGKPDEILITVDN